VHCICSSDTTTLTLPRFEALNIISGVSRSKMPNKLATILHSRRCEVLQSCSITCLFESQVLNWREQRFAGGCIRTARPARVSFSSFTSLHMYFKYIYTYAPVSSSCFLYSLVHRPRMKQHQELPEG